MIELNTFHNCDCMQLMKEFPDKYFDLALCDPPYGSAVQIAAEPSALAGGAADWQLKNRSRFGGRFDKYHIGAPNRGNVGDEVSDAHRGYL